MFNEPVSQPNDERRSPDPFAPMPPPTEGEREPLVRPKAVDTAFQASVASTLIGALGTVFTVLLDRAQLTDLVTDMLSGVPDAQRDVPETVDLFQFIFAFSVAVFVGLFLLFAFKMRAGRNWARLALTVFAVIGVANFLSGVANSGAELELMWNLAEVAFATTAVVYMYRKESTQYFADYKQRRQRQRQQP